ncbi:hypothetical protein BH09ACT5_BH09ACT5_09970 [soil metagenome]
MSHTIRRRAIIAIAAVSTVAALAGCSIVSTQGDATPSAAPSGAASDGVEYAKAQLEAAMASPEFVAPGPEFDASKAAGKSVWFIPNSSSIPFTVAVQKAFETIADKVGINLTVWPSTGKPTEWVQGIDQAIAQDADLVVMAAPPQLVGPQLAALADAGIPVVVPHQYDPTMEKPEDVTAFEYAPFLDAAKLMADQAIVDTNGKANTLVITTNESPPSKPMADAIRAEFEEYCDECSITEVNVPVADWGSKMQSEVQTALLRDPDMNYIITIFDSATQFVVPGVAAAGKTGSVGIATFNNTPFVLENVQKGVVNMDVGESINWIGYASMDQVLRILSGVEPSETESATLRVFTKENADELGTPADNEKGYDEAYIAAYEKLWGID